MADDLETLRQQLAAMLLKARQGARISRLGVAKELDCDPSKVYRFEKAETSIVSRGELKALIQLYKVSSGEAREIERLWRAIRQAKSQRRIKKKP